jgi:hypothetical protein
VLAHRSVAQHTGCLCVAIHTENKADMFPSRVCGSPVPQ